MTSTAPAQNKPNEGETTTDAAVRPNPAMAPVDDVPGLPRVLLIGDSVSIGYTIPVQEELKGKANVHRIPANGETTASGLYNLDRWLGNQKWDVIHFNFGLHDAKYLPNNQTKVSREDYEKNLTEIVRRLQATGAKLIWASTTPTPEILKPEGRRFDSIPAYNAIAAQVMGRTGVPVDDLYALVLPREIELQRPFDVHFTDAGYTLLARSVAASILAQLPAK